MRRTLYLTEPDLTLRRVGQALLLERGDRLLERVYLRYLEQVFVLGEALLDPGAISALAGQGIPVVWLTENGRFVARLSAAAGGTPSLRRAQYATMAAPEPALADVRAVLRCKLAGCRGLLLRHCRNRGWKQGGAHPPPPEVDEALDTLKRVRARLVHTRSLGRMRGLEGHAAAAYFRAWPWLLRQPLEFPGRQRRPTVDPVNAVLSLAYGLLRCEIEGQLEGFGLDPRVGFLHVERAGRPALALDLMEEFRPVVAERLTLRLFNLRALTPEDFTRDDLGACRLSKEGRQRFFGEYERLMREPYTDLGSRRLNCRRLLHVQVRELADSFRQARTYVPHQPRL